MHFSLMVEVTTALLFGTLNIDIIYMVEVKTNYCTNYQTYNFQAKKENNQIILKIFFFTVEQYNENATEINVVLV
jgi:hypothetical protein